MLPTGFDAAWYYGSIPMAAAGLDPYDHHIEYGARERRRYTAAETSEATAGGQAKHRCFRG